LRLLDRGDPAYAELARRADAEERAVGLAGLRQMREAAFALWAENVPPAAGEPKQVGAILIFETAALEFAAARRSEAEERGKAANAAFRDIWKAAEPLFADDATAPEACPVCATPLGRTEAGSAAGIRAHTASHLSKLADYAAAKRKLDEAERAASQAHVRLSAALPSLAGLLGEDRAALRTKLTSYRVSLDAWSDGDAPTSAAVVAGISALTVELRTAIADIEERQGEHTYVGSKRSVDRLLELRAERLLAVKTQEELEKLSAALTMQATAVSTQIRKKVQSLL
jgi:hypothetical protein